MARLTLIFFIIYYYTNNNYCVVCANEAANGTHLPTEMEFKQGTAVEAKYLLPAVNVSVENSANRFVTANLARMLNFFNTEQLAANWDRVQKGLTLSCRKDVELFIEGLNKADNWALKSKLNVPRKLKLKRENVWVLITVL